MHTTRTRPFQFSLRSILLLTVAASVVLKVVVAIGAVATAGIAAYLTVLLMLLQDVRTASRRMPGGLGWIGWLAVAVLAAGGMTVLAVFFVVMSMGQ